MDTTSIVLWAHHFDELLATIFVTELRRAGKPVKLVGLSSGPTTGAYGLGLVPDLTFGQALPLAHFVNNVIIPCGEAGLYQFDHEPRFRDFFQCIQNNNALFVLGWIPRHLDDPKNLLHGMASFTAVLSEREDLISFVRSHIHQFARGIAVPE